MHSYNQLTETFESTLIEKYTIIKWCKESWGKHQASTWKWPQIIKTL